MPVRLIIDYVTVLVALAGVVLGLIAGPRPTDFEKIKFKYASAILLGGALVLFGVSRTVAIMAANRRTVVGMLTDLKQSRGRHSYSSFVVVGNDGVPLTLKTDYAGDKLQDFQQISVTYVEGFSTVIYLQVLPQGWTLKEGDGSVGAILVAATGVLVFFKLKPA